LRIARWAFPGWKLEISGQAADWRASEDGSIEVDVPAGETRVELRYRAPRERTLGLVVSGLALGAWFSLLARRRLPLWKASGP
jgi:uncharacterized membrane protein YfhO